MSRTKNYILVMLMILPLIFGCGLLGGGSPEKVTKDWLEAGLNQDMDTFMKLTCTADRGAVTESGFHMALLGGLANYLGFDVEINADLSDLEFTTVEQDQQSAIVSVNGTLFASVNEMPMETPINDEWVHLVKEDGKWRVCSSATSSPQSGDTSGPSNADLKVELPADKSGFFVVSGRDLLPLREVEGMMLGPIDLQDFPSVQERFPVVLLRSEEIEVTQIQLIRLTAGLGFSMWETEQGVEVSFLQNNSGAQAMDLQLGDVILSINGVEVEGSSSKVQQLIPTQFNQPVKMKVLRGTQTFSLEGETVTATNQESVSFKVNPTDGGYVQLFPETALADGLYCYSAMTGTWCFVIGG